MRIFSIASGSSGNCVYVGSLCEDGRTGKTHLLVDAGISAKRIVAGLAQNFISPEQIDGILITHEHSDHIKGLSVLARKYRIPIYGTLETLQAIASGSTGKEIPTDFFVPIEVGREFIIGDIRVNTCNTSHDALNPILYTFSCKGKKLGFATDLGCFSDEIVGRLCGADMLYIESNYDRNMLLVGIYPYYLKQRILGRGGHLSNDDSAELVGRLLHAGLRVVMLAHLSKENNYPQLAYQTMKNEIDRAWCFSTEHPRLLVADRDVPSECITL